MIKFLVERPIAVFMAFTAFFILGFVTYLNVPVSLLPDIAIPEITVQIAGKDNSARELENTVVTPVRRQLQQIGKLRDIKSETKDGSAIIRLSFDYGTDTELAFIEVNEKIDAAMGRIPKEIDRPRVIKASATDIPVFNLNLTLKNDKGIESLNEVEFLNLSEFAETVIKRRIEQLPQVSMVDMTGLVHKQILITPDESQMKISGITLSDIENALKNNNVEPGSMTVKDGHYEYNIRFSAVMRTIEDIQDIYIRKNDRLFQLKDIASIGLTPEKERGINYFNGKRAITLAVIKQADENMDNLREALDKVVRQMNNRYPEISFDISQNQAELLDYTISNLKQNLILAFIFICVVSMLFLKDVRSPLIIGLSIFVSLIISLLFFYLFHVSLNVVSLTGLILALGMMIDNSIIVTDNIGQYRKMGLTLNNACIHGASEVITPMLSSALTTISVFVPLVFLSGIAGAIFFDQAFSVAVGLLVSYITGITLLPVLYKAVYSIKKPSFFKRRNPFKPEKDNSREEKVSVHEKVYHAFINRIFRHKILTVLIIILIFPLCVWFFMVIPKEKMPDISQNEMILNIEWNENIHIDENKERTNKVLENIGTKLSESSVSIGQQQYLLNRKRELTSSESEVYIKADSDKDIPAIKDQIGNFFEKNYPSAIISFSPAVTIFERIFVTGEPGLTVEYYTKNKSTTPDAEEIMKLNKFTATAAGKNPEGVSFEKQLNIYIDKQKLTLYNISYNEIYQALKTGFRENEFAMLRSQEQYLPIILGNQDKEVREVIDNIMVNTSSVDTRGKQNTIPLSTFISIVPTEDIKTIVAGKNGEYIPFNFYETEDAGKVVKNIQAGMNRNPDWDVSFSGTFFSNKKMIAELIIILLISIMLMYFILAAQFESFTQPLIVLFEIPIDIAAALGLLIITGHTLNLMSAIGIVVTCGIIINDSILKIDIMNQLRKKGLSLMEAIHEAGRRRLNAILMTSLTSIVCMLPLLFSNDMGSELEKPLAIATIGGMLVGTPVSLFLVPLIYWRIYKNK